MQQVFHSVGLIGYGRFGRLMIEILRRHAPEIEVRVASRTQAADGKLFFPPESVYRCDLLIPCVPIRAFRGTIAAMAASLHAGQTVLDVCSVKVHPRRVMLELLPPGVNIVCSHPMFGPASYQKLGGRLEGCSVVMECVRAEPAVYEALQGFFSAQKLQVIEMEADEHDRLAATFHFVALTAATLLRKLQLRRSRIDTKSASLLMDFLEMISVDRDLVKDLYEYNAYCKKEFELLEGAFEELRVELQGRGAPAGGMEGER